MSSVKPGYCLFHVISQINGKTYNIVVKESHLRTIKIKKVKKSLQKVTGVPEGDQVLYANDVEMKDDKSAGYYGLEPHSILLLVSRSSEDMLSQLRKQTSPTMKKTRHSPRDKNQSPRVKRQSPRDKNQSPRVKRQSPRVKNQSPRVRKGGMSPNRNNSRPSSRNTRAIRRASPRRSMKETPQMDPSTRLKNSSRNMEASRTFNVSPRPSLSRAPSPLPLMVNTSTPMIQKSQNSKLSPRVFNVDQKPGSILRRKEKFEATSSGPLNRVQYGKEASRKTASPNLSKSRNSSPRRQSPARKIATNSREPSPRRTGTISRMKKTNHEKDHAKIKSHLNPNRISESPDKSILQLEEHYELIFQEQLASEKQNLLRLLNESKRQILQKANEDRQILVQENNRLRSELEGIYEGQGLNSLHEENKELRNQIKEHEILVETLQSKKSEGHVDPDLINDLLQKERSQYEALMNEKLKESKVLQSRFDSDVQLYQGELRDAQELISQYSTEIQSLKSNLDRMEEVFYELNEDYKKKSLSLETVDKAFDSLNHQIQKLTNGDITASNQIVELTRQLEIEKRRVEVYERDSKKLRDNLFSETRKRKRIHNILQDIRGNIRVIVRVRPLQSSESLPSTDGRVDIVDDAHIRVTSNAVGSRSFFFYKVLGPMSTQSDVFDEVKPLVQSAIDGYNVTILAYGQTGAGKTYTISGDRGSGELRGLLPRTAEELFNLLRNNNIWELPEENGIPNTYSVKCSMVEVYIDSLNDLLTPGNKNKLSVRQQPSGDVFVQGLSEHVIKSPKELLDFIEKGNESRQVYKTKVHDKSSRSHAIFTISLTVHHGSGSTRKTTQSKLVFVDLAGSERVSKSQATGQRFKELQHINKSLSCLGDVISSLSERRTHVPYRNTKLTQLLKSSLGGQSKTVMFANLSPDAESVSESQSTLSFASRVKNVRNLLVQQVVDENI